MPATAAKTKVTTRKRGRPRAENPQRDRRMVNLTERDGRRLNRYLRAKGIESDAELLRDLVLRLLDSHGVEDPGPESPEGLPLSGRRRATNADVQESQQLILEAA